MLERPMTLKDLRLSGIMIAAALLLLVPFIAMQVTSDVKWGAMDFVVAGALLFGTGLACEMVLTRVTSNKIRMAICTAILVILIVVWAELAVGLFGTPFAGS